MENINEFISWAKKSNWNVILEKNSINDLPDNNIIKKYNIPDTYKIFLENVKICLNEEETIWFLCINDYLEESKSFSIWDEYKDLLLQFSWDEENEMEYYFNKMFPIIINVSSKYKYFGKFKYYAINTETNEIIVGYGNGYGEECEDIKIISNDFETFLDKITNGEIVI
jgi:hypothetical protein